MRNEKYRRTGHNPDFDRRTTYDIAVRLHRHRWIGRQHELLPAKELHPGVRPKVPPEDTPEQGKYITARLGHKETQVQLPVVGPPAGWP